MVGHIVSAASSETGIASVLQHHMLFIFCKIVGSERCQGNQVTNKEQHFQVVAKGKYARILVCLTMKNVTHFIITVAHVKYSY